MILGPSSGHMVQNRVLLTPFVRKSEIANADRGQSAAPAAGQRANPPEVILRGSVGITRTETYCPSHRISIPIQSFEFAAHDTQIT